MEELKDFESPESMVQAVYDRAKEILLMNSFPTFGGEHSRIEINIKTLYCNWMRMQIL